MSGPPRGGRRGPELLLRRLLEASADLREAALLDRDGNQLAATDDSDWAESWEALWRAADAAGGAPASQLHVAAAAGEVFTVRDGAASVVATGERFALASLVFCDLRAVLRAHARERG